MNRTVQPVAGGIRNADSILFVVIQDDAYDRTEDLLPRDHHVISDIVEYDRLNVVALRESEISTVCGTGLWGSSHLRAII